ncbi:hypothetical protein ABEB36_006143 [Hypothenemus hampei]|uniref:rhamnogalacturonan endolyase n=1 Tax=Hypothenemus hampei TaxID=57062 RepID=A0ABD1F0M7_HYPHA
MNLNIFGSLLVCGLHLTLTFGGDVTLNITEDGHATISNDLFNVTFDNNASVLALGKNGKDLVGTVTARTFYFDWNAGGGKFLPTEFKIITNSSNLVHIMYFQPFSHKRLEMDGFYQWLKVQNNGNETVKMSEFRMVYRLSKSLMPYINNMRRNGVSPNNFNSMPTIQDTTWQLTDGSYWSKYDYVSYIRETPWFGVYGGGVGSWVISPSREYHGGGPLKQELLTQHESLMCHYLTSKHFGTLEFDTKPGWSKFYGPWLLYINSGDNEMVVEDVARQAKIEIDQWPYNWMEDSDFPIERGTVMGSVTGQLSAEVVIYDSFDEPFEYQTRGYLYNNKTDENGNYVIKNIRPGNYSLIIYPLAGQGSENLITKNITVVSGNQVLDPLDLTEPIGILWAVGETNRRSDNFRYSDELRNFYWHMFPPENLTFYIGKSNSNKDWYYAQTHNGTWKVVFEDMPNGRTRTLRIAIAAASGSLIFNLQSAKLRVSLNDALIFEKEYENEGAIYRGMLQSGKFYSEKIEIPSENVTNGTNVIALTVVYGGFMYDAISYQIND